MQPSGHVFYHSGKKIFKKFLQLKKVYTFAPVITNTAREPLRFTTNIALWCNGSTSDSGSACEGSNPSKATS